MGRAVPRREADPEPGVRVLAQVRDAVLSGRRAPVAPRPEVSDSWRRCLRARVDPEHGRPPRVFDEHDVGDLRAEHPLAAVVPGLRDTLLAAADEAMQILIVTDAHGLILWREGATAVLHRADRVSLVEGTRWDEASIGTNAMGTSLAAGRALRIHSAEHLVAAYHRWTCAAAPIHDPGTGEVLGAVDLTGPVSTFHAGTLALVSAAARLAEHHLAADLARRDEARRARNLPHLAGLGGEPGALLDPAGRVLAASPHGWVGDRVPVPEVGRRVPLGADGDGVLEPLTDGWLLRRRRPDPGRRTLDLPFLGATGPVARLGGRELRLGRRHAELLVLLALHPDGLRADALAAALYGDHGNPVTVRAEMHRLRGALEALPGGGALLRTQPYRLDAHVDADFLDLRAALRAGRLPPAALIRRGELLPASEAPGVCELRDELEAGVRTAALGRGDADAVRALAEGHGLRDDPEVAARLGALLAADDPRRAAPSAP